MLVDEEGRWYLIDWEWAGDHHDWRMMLSHLVGSWYVQDIRAGGAGGMPRAAGRDLALDYRPGVAHLLLTMGGPARSACHSLSRVSRHQQDLLDPARHAALLLLREVPWAVRRGQTRHVSALIGECVRLATPETALSHPLISILTDPAPDEGHR